MESHNGKYNPAYAGTEGSHDAPPSYAIQQQQQPYPQPGYAPQAGHQVNYNVAYPPPGVAQPAQHTVIVQQQAVARPSSYLVLSCIVYWCCNCLFGTIAFALSLASSNAADDNDMSKARTYGRAAMWVSIAGIIVTVVTVIIAVIVYFVVLANAVNEVNSYNSNYSNYYN